jgi:O-antigen ligase
MGLRALLLLAFLVAGGGFSLQLSGLDPQAPVGADSASVRSQAALGAAFAVLFLFGAAGWRQAISLLRTNAILLTLPVLALVSTLWAPEPAVALRRALAFAATVLGGLAVAAYRPGTEALRVVAQAASAAMVLSIAYVFLAPGYGVHQITDGVQSTHAGDWRGVFVHRTALGQLAALALALAVYEGRTAFRHWTLRAAVIAAALIGLLMARSVGGMVSAAILLSAPWLFRLGARVAARAPLIAVASTVSAFPLAIGLALLLVGPVLHGLGRDETLTGRAPLWRLMLSAARARPWLGYGYSTGFRDGVAKLVADHSAFGYVPNAQNGYLDVTLNLGLAGLALATAVLATAVWRAVRLALSRAPGGTTAPLLIVIFIVEMNLVEAALISANDIFVLIFATAFAASGQIIKSRRDPAPP